MLSARPQISTERPQNAVAKQQILADTREKSVEPAEKLNRRKLNNTTGVQNTANGEAALQSNTTGFGNTATGFAALTRNTTGGSNTATGFQALFHKTASNNTAMGNSALANNTTGASNIALGANAGSNLTTGSNNIDIGSVGVAAEANTIRIGKVGTQKATFIAGISGATVPTGGAVIVDSSGHLGTTKSSARFNEEIKPMDKASEAILQLKPVTFRSNQNFRWFIGIVNPRLSRRRRTFYLPSTDPDLAFASLAQRWMCGAAPEVGLPAPPIHPICTAFTNR